MSLQVWLPLIKDLNNQGLDNIAITTANTNIFQNEGKLGNKSLDVSGHYAFRVPSLVKKRVFSCSFWYKPITDNSASDNWRRIIVFDTFTSDGSTTGAIFRFESSYGYQSSSTQYCISIHNNVGEPIASIGTGLGPTDGWNQWHHIAITADGTTLRCYRNGEQIATGNMGNGGMLQGIVHIGYTGNRPIGRLNDFRLYDHCLSPMEVKEISKGLILHYPLIDKCVENTTNLINTEDCLSSTCYNGSINKYGYGTNTDMYKTVTTYDGHKGTKVYMGTNGNTCYPYVYISNMFTSNGTNAPAYKTLSFDYYTTISTSISPYKLGSGTGTATYRVFNNINGLKTGTGTNSVVIPIVPNTWNHVEVTFHGTTDANAEWGYIQNQPAHTSNTSNFWFFANMQLETKDHATGYAGVGGTRTTTTIYDCSGFYNNGIISGSLTISNDTPKYQCSTQMPAAATISHARCLDNTNQEWTCAAWVKPAVAGNYQNLNNFNESNRLYHGTYPLLYLNSGTNDYYNYGNLALPVNQWSHIAFVFKNSNGTKLIYINGENHTNTSGPNKTSTPKGIPDTVIIGGGNYKGGLCDYREYATALSADDVKSLYQNEAYIDSSGTIHGQIR